VLKGNGRCGHKCGSCDCVLRKFQEGRHGLINFFAGVVFWVEATAAAAPSQIHRSDRCTWPAPLFPCNPFLPVQTGLVPDVTVHLLLQVLPISQRSVSASS